MHLPSVDSSRILLVFAAIVAVIYLTYTFSPHTDVFVTRPYDIKDVKYPHVVPPIPNRVSDTIDTFASYKYREECGVSSLDLHMPFSPLCPDRASVLNAMSDGGRAGFEAPYIPRGCDMRWYSTEEVCDILGRFDQILFIGDSLIRHIVNTLWIYIRADIGYGAIQDDKVEHGVSWDLRISRKSDCMCYNQYKWKTCSMLLFRNTEDAVANIPDRMVCKPGSFNVQYRDGERWPLQQEWLQGYTAGVPKDRPRKPIPVIVDHSLHNKASLHVSNDYMDQLTKQFNDTILWSTGADGGLYMPKLYISPGSGTYKKNPDEMNTQNVNLIANFERGIRPIVEAKGYEFLGAYNMSVQADSYDGTHNTMEGNLLKTQMVLNWLDKLEIPSIAHDDPLSELQTDEVHPEALAASNSAGNAAHPSDDE